MSCTIRLLEVKYWISDSPVSIINLNFTCMDMHDIIAFKSEGKKIIGIVIEHYSNPLDDFYVVYADYALHKVTSPEEDSKVIIENVIFPACDAALADYRVKRQHLIDLGRFRKEVEAIVEALSNKNDLKSMLDSEC